MQLMQTRNGFSFEQFTSYFTVDIVNTCRKNHAKCLAKNVRVSCPDYVPDPLTPVREDRFRRDDYSRDVCTVNNDLPINESITFQYEMQHMASLSVITVDYVCV